MPDVQDPGFKVIESLLLQHDAIPLFGGSPPFPLEELLTKANDLFGVEGLTGRLGAAQWRDLDHFYQGMATPSFPLDIVCGEMEGRAIWLMSDSDWDKLMTWLLTKEATTWGIPDSGIREGFLKFAAAETLSLVGKSGFGGGLAFRMAEHRGMPEEPALGIDVTLDYQGETAVGRLLVTSSFHRSWSEQFAPRKPREISPELASSVEVDVHLEVGSVSLSRDNWAELQVGDCLFLDQCNWDPDQRQGQVVLTTDNKALYQGNMNSQGAIEITQGARGTRNHS